MKAFSRNVSKGLLAALVAAACLVLPAIAFAVGDEPGNQAANTAPAANTAATNQSATNESSGTVAENTAVPANTVASENLPTDGQKTVNPGTSAEQQQKDRQQILGDEGPGPIDLGDGNLVNPLQLPDSSFIYDITIADLSKADSYLNGQTVQVVGEVVGDVINAEFEPEYCWVVLADAAGNTVSVYMPAEQKDLIDTFGRYGQTGTQLQVRGVFSLSCDQHQGQTDIHSAHVNVVRKGSVHHDVFDPTRFIPGAIVVGIGLAMLFVYWRMRERLR